LKPYLGLSLSVGFGSRATTHRVYAAPPTAVSTMQQHLVKFLLALALGAATSMVPSCPRDEQPDGHIALVQRHAKSSQVEVAEDKDPRSRDCSGCSFVGDLRCQFKFKDEYFHRINNCLWPQYDVVTASRNATGLRCFMVDKSLEEVLKPLVSDMDTCMISSMAEGVEALPDNVQKSVWTFPGGIPPKGVDQQTSCNGSHWCSGSKPNMYLTTNRHAMARDAAQVVSHIDSKQPYVVLILRKETSRELDVGSTQLLTSALNNLGRNRGFTVVTYDGSPTQKDTINLFAHAAGVVGWHGAAFANVLFASKPTCVVEMQTFRDIDYSDNTLARTMDFWATSGFSFARDPLPPWKDYSIVGVPLRQIIHVNNAETSVASHSSGGLASDDFIVKGMSRVHITEQDVTKVVATLDNCL